MTTPRDLFPGFKTPPNDPSRDLVYRRDALHVSPPPEEYDADRDYDEGLNEEGPPCKNCEGWGYTDCFCGGDLCVCGYNGERPCWTCV